MTGLRHADDDREDEKREEQEASEGHVELEAVNKHANDSNNHRDDEIAIVTLTPLNLTGKIANDDDPQREPLGLDAAISGASPVEQSEPEKPIKLYKSSRLKGYITLVLASFINYQSAQESADTQSSNITVVPSTAEQRRYAVAVAVVSLVLSVFCLLTHLDRVTPLEKVWIIIFKNGSKVEGIMLALWSIWWIAGTGVSTAISGIAGDGKGQYSLYYSTWVCCLTTLWCLERWWVAMGWVSDSV